jgi:uncharacterized protein (DUF58 family)
MVRLNGSFAVLLFVLVGLAINLVLDVAFGVPTAARWGIALVAMLLLTAAVELSRRRMARRHPDVQVQRSRG